MQVEVGLGHVRDAFHEATWDERLGVPSERVLKNRVEGLKEELVMVSKKI